MNPLHLPYLHLIFSFLDLKEIIKLLSLNQILYKLILDEEIWKIRFFKKNLSSLQYYNYTKTYYLKNNSSICGICGKNMTTNNILLFHNCNLNLKRCLICNNKNCSCYSYTIYHKSCLNKYENFFYCPLCNLIVSGYFIKYNI